ncbi:MAG TPA: PAS domain S-box protein, partial [Balneolaceae bacterium]|nr:PAS domain S-box protein [Balneolaceae bacterium]
AENLPNPSIYNVYAFRFGQPEKQKVAVLFQDITAYEKAVEKIRRSEDKYRSLFETIHEGYGIIEVKYNGNDKPVDYNIIEINPKAEELLGLINLEEKGPKEVFAEYKSHLLTIYAKVILTQEPIHFEKYLDRFECYYKVSVYPYGDRQEQKVAILFNDITERKQNERSNDQLAAIVNNADDAIFSKDLNGIIMSWNKGAQEIFGYSVDEVIDRPITMLFPEDRLEEENKILGSLKRGNRIKNYETVRKRKDGTFINVSMTVSPVRNKEGRIVGISKTVRDITKRKRQEERLKILNERLEERVEQRTAALLSYQKQLRSLAMQLSRAEENERKRLAAELHDNLGQMLAVIKMRIDSIQKGQDLEAISETAQLVDDAIAYARKLMSDLKPPPSLKEKDMSHALKWVIEMMEQYKLDINFRYNIQDEPTAGEPIQTALVQAVRELLFNVVKHAGTKEAQITLSYPGDQVEVTVEDSGKGFDMKNTELAVTEDSGFGLFHIKERLDILGGGVDIISKRGEGTKVTLIAPLKAAQEAAGQEAAVDGTQAEPIKVLLVDDHEMMREGLRKIIEDEPDLTVVAEAADAETAIDTVDETATDVVIMDINLPGMNGIQATKIIKDGNYEINIIGLSFHADDKVRQEMYDAGASAYLEKVNASETLCAVIRSEGRAS